MQHIYVHLISDQRNPHQLLMNPNLDTAAGDVVIIAVNPDGPYGAVFMPDNDGNALVLKSFESMPSGKFGPLQKHGGLHYGDVLFEINDIQLGRLSYTESSKILNDGNIFKKNLKFLNSKEYYRRKQGTGFKAQTMDGRNNFLSVIKRYRVAEVKNKKFAEFEIACQFRVGTNKVQQDSIYQWSVWKRYSELESLHSVIKKSLGWQMDGIEFPSSYTFVMNKLSNEFMEQRRDELKNYWLRLVAIEKITDFTKHHCSQDLKEFLAVEENMKKGEVKDSLPPDLEELKSTPQNANATSNNSTNVNGRPKSSRHGSMKRLSSMNLNKQNNILSLDSTENITSGASEIPSTNISPPPPETGSSVSNAAPNVRPPMPTKSSVDAQYEDVSLQSTAQQSSAPIKSSAPQSISPVSIIPVPIGETSALPPKAAGARANLLGAIAALRKD